MACELMAPSRALATVENKTAPPVAVTTKQWAEFFRGIEGEASFVVVDNKGKDLVRYNARRAKRRFVPASTFKIPNALIALETGVAPDADFVIPWDPSSSPRRGSGCLPGHVTTA